MRSLRFAAQLENFHEDEAKCNCGCGKDTSPTLMVKLQSFIYWLERKTGSQIICILSGPARCRRHQINVYDGEYRQSYHMGINRIDMGKGFPGAALDVIMKIKQPNGRYQELSKEYIAEQAIEFNLFGGVGWKIYGSSLDFVHLDEGPVRTF